MNLAIVGPQCAGKTTFANYCEGTIIRFAQPLYDINHILGVGKDRQFMQKLSSLVKKRFGRDIFIKKFKDALNVQGSLICDDVRFPMELEFLKKAGWRSVYITADAGIRKTRAEALGLDFLPYHESELGAEMLRDKCDVYFDNSHTSLQTLQELAEIILED